MKNDKNAVRERFKSRLIAALRDNGVPEHGKGVWLSREMKVTPKAAGKWINGESMPGPERWEELAKTLGKPSDYFSRSESGSVSDDEAKRIVEDICKEFTPSQLSAAISELATLLQSKQS